MHASLVKFYAFIECVLHAHEDCTYFMALFIKLKSENSLLQRPPSPLVASN